MILLSIIIPVYNSQSYISRCLLSCLDQNIPYENYEIIVVDDGSIDNSIDRINEFHKKNENVVVVRQENKGVSSARNIGISIAKGAYVLFVDSDDTIKRNSLCAIIECLNNNKNDLTILNSTLYKDELRLKDVYVFPLRLRNETTTGEILFLDKYLRGSVCGVVFNRSFLANYKLLFPESVKNGEDSIFMTFCFIYAKCVKHLNLDFYEVRIREDSASRSWNLEKVKQMITSLNCLESFLADNILTKVQKAMIYNRAYRIISNSLNSFFLLNSFNGYSDVKLLIKNSKMYPVKTFGFNHFKIKILLLNISIDLFCLPILLRHQIWSVKKLFL